MMKIAICDDEPFMVKEISAHLSRYMKEKHIDSYCINHFFDGSSLLESRHNFDLIFLDIQMAPSDGMKTARELRRRGNHSLLIFITVLKEWVMPLKWKRMIICSNRLTAIILAELWIG